MPLFVKTEFIKEQYLSNFNLRDKIIQDHIIWVKQLKTKGVNIKSGITSYEDFLFLKDLPHLEEQ